MASVKHPIHERIYQFILKVLRFIKKFPKTYESQIIINQLSRALTSIGANDQEADGTLTRPDFIHCYTIVRKEGKESVFWIRLLGDLYSQHQDEARELINEGEEIVAVVTSIIFKTKQKE